MILWIFLILFLVMCIHALFTEDPIMFIVDEPGEEESESDMP